jgi:hypothetical protein
MTGKGPEQGRPAYRRTRDVLLRGLGVVYLSAFWSLAVQVDGLIGARGILPAAGLLDHVSRGIRSPLTRFQVLPTLLWLSASDLMLQVYCWGGVLLAVALIGGLFPGVSLVLLWLFYLSLTTAGDVFLGYQWDSLLLEAGFLAILLAPWSLWLRAARDEPWPFAIWLFRWLAIRVMFLSGVVKLTSGDKTWWAWKALEHHYQTQPLPAWTSWYVHQLPPGLHAMSVGFMFYAELIAPFLVFGPRPVRLIGFASMVLLQVLIAATGNYGFFNLLAVVLCYALLDDRDWSALESWRERVLSWSRDLDSPGPENSARRWSLPRRIVIGGIGGMLLLATGAITIETVWPEAVLPGELIVLQNRLSPFRVANHYGLFAVMTTRRPEIEVEASDDAIHWRPYRFRWKPCELDRAPRFALLHMPRLDWQMWFAALGRTCRDEPWFLHFEERLLEGSPQVLALLRDPPLGRRPRYIRASLFRYQFTRGRGSDWWERTELGLYCPPMSLQAGSSTRESESGGETDGD